MSKRIIRTFNRQSEAAAEVVSLITDRWRVIGRVGNTVVLRHGNGNVMRVSWLSQDV